MNVNSVNHIFALVQDSFGDLTQMGFPKNDVSQIIPSLTYKNKKNAKSLHLVITVITARVHLGQHVQPLRSVVVLEV